MKVVILLTCLTVLSTCELVGTALWMARATRRRRRISFNKDVICCGELVMVVDKKVVHSFKMCDHIKVMCVSGRQHCGWQGQHAEETMDSVTL